MAAQLPGQCISIMQPCISACLPLTCAVLAAAAVLVHCGAGASRSAALCMAYLMRAQGLSAEQARAHCRARRSVVLPNDGFWRALCALERQLGLHARCCQAKPLGAG